MTAEDRAAHVEREAVAGVIRLLSSQGTSGRFILDYDVTPEMVADAVLAALPQTGDAAAVLDEVIRDSRIRHDHDYPMEFGPHHCDGCDLEDRIRAALTAGADQ